MLSPLTALPKNAKVAVGGSGIAGLSFAYFLAKMRPDVSVTLYEKAARNSGWINSWQTKDKNGQPVMIERGPRTLRGVSDGTVMMIDAMKDLKSLDIVHFIEHNSDADKKFLLDPNDKLVKVPDSFLSGIKFIMSDLGKGIIPAMLGEFWRKASANPGKDETVASMLDRRMGNEHLGKNVFSAIYRGIYADDINTLSAKKVMHKMVANELKYGSNTKALIHSLKTKKDRKKNADSLTSILDKYTKVMGKEESKILELSKKLKHYPMLGFKGGLESFCQTLLKGLESMPNVSVLNNSAITKLISDAKSDNNNITVEINHGKSTEKFDHVRLTGIPHRLGPLLREIDGHIADSLETIKANTVVLVNFYLPDKDVIPKKNRGFGYLVPESNPNKEKLLGVIFDSVIEQNLKNIENAQEMVSSDKKSYTKLTAMVGGYMYNDPATGEPVVPKDEQIIDAVRNTLERHLGVSPNDLDRGLWQVTPANKCLPKYNVGYMDWQTDMEKKILKLFNNKVSIGGMGFAIGPGIPDVFADGFQDALKLR